MLPHGTKMMNLVPSIVYINYDEKASVKGLWGSAEVLIGLEGQQTASSVMINYQPRALDSTSRY